MTIPKLKRIRISSEQELGVWLGKAEGQARSVMLVTVNDTTSANFVSGAAIRSVLDAHGWVSGPRYTLAGGLIGHVISPPGQTGA